MVTFNFLDLLALSTALYWFSRALGPSRRPMV